MDLQVELEEIVARMASREQYATKQLKNSPQGWLTYEKYGKSGVLIQENRDAGVRKRHKLLKDEALAAALVRKMILTDESAALKHNIEVLKTAIAQINDYSLNASLRRMTNKNPYIGDKLISEALKDPAAEAWAAEPYEQCDFHPEEKKQVNSHGLRVRSKSEVLITEKLYEFNQVFRYEQVMHIGDIKLNPDFTIRRSDGKIFIWEHEGLTNVQSYVDWQMKKAKLYASAGFVPWDNLIVTYDNADGIIDLRIVEAEIRNKLLI